jgi:hypothetical protein
MSLIQQWLAGLIGLGALYLALAPDSHLAQAFSAAQLFITGTMHTVMTGK